MLCSSENKQQTVLHKFTFKETRPLQMLSNQVTELVQQIPGRYLIKYQDIVVIKRWVPILKEYEQTKAKVTPRPFRFVKDLCEAHHIHKKELRRYYLKWIEGGRKDESLFPGKRGPRPVSRRTPKDMERNIIKAYRRFGSNRYELVLLFKSYYLDKTPSPATMDGIKRRYPLNKHEEKNNKTL